jgi:phosphoglycerate kinase
MSVANVEALCVEPGMPVLVRVDFNVPLRPSGEVLDDRRIRMALPTIASIVDRGGIAVCMSHLGRPAGTGPEVAFSMAPAAGVLQSLLGDAHHVHFVRDACRGDKAHAAVKAASPGDVVLLDNLRFEAGEKAGDKAFAQDLASLGCAYVNDAFGTAHRSHASMVAVPQAMSPKPCVAGLLLEKELQFLGEAIASPQRPFVAVLGGAKVSDKLGAIRNLLSRVDAIVVGGGMAYTFLAAQGVAIGQSLLETDMLETASSLLAEAAELGKAIHLPSDHVCAVAIEQGAPTQVTSDQVPEGWMGLDIGPNTQASFVGVVETAGTVVWNGPMGVFEVPPFNAGTLAVARAMQRATERGAITIVGGGETAAAVEAAGVAQTLSHVSTGGGASLRMLEGLPFASVACLDSA